jgi:uncharacterized membrane protein YbhN (UPF0104 family)
MRPGWIERIVHNLLAAVAIGAMLIVLWQNRQTIAEASAQRFDLRLLGLALLITHASLLITFVRWSFLVKVIEPRFTVRCSVLLGFIGYVYNLAIPGAVGGDVIKATYLSRISTRTTRAIASTVIDRIVGLVGLFILAAVAGLLAWKLATPKVHIVIVAVWCALVLAVVTLAPILCGVSPRFFPRPDRGRLGQFAAIMAELDATSETYRRRPGVLLGSLGLSLISHGLNVIVFYLIGKMLFSSRLTTTLAQHFLMAPLTFFTMSVPLPFGALGLTEEVGGQLFHLVGHPGGAVAMMGLRLLMLVCGLEGACVYLFNLREIRDLSTASRFNGKETAAQGSPPARCG